MADLLPAFPAGLWLMAASMLVRITRFARSFSLLSPASAIILISLVGRLHRSGFHAWRCTGWPCRWSGIWSRSTYWGTASNRLRFDRKRVGSGKVLSDLSDLG